MKGVKYIGPVYDFSGYAEASRNYVLALHRAGVPITVEPHCFDANPPEVGSVKDREDLKSIVGKNIEFDTVIVHLTPDLLPHYRKKYKDKYLISYTVWETSLLHPKWVQCCNSNADEIWVPCDWNIEAFKASGVTTPMFKIHHGIDVEMFDGVTPETIAASGIASDSFTFLSVMQWNFRKNPEGLLRAYFNAFTSKDNVRLILKAYIGGTSPSNESRIIKEIVTNIKLDMQLPDYPKVILVTDKLSTEGLRSLYTASDAYVSLTRGEGFGLTMFEAGLAGLPVIATGMGGNMEFMSAETSYPIPFIWDYVQGMSTFNPWYLGNQKWAHPSLPSASEEMRYVYNHPEESKAKGKLLSQHIKTNFSWDHIASKIIDRLESI